MQKKIKKTGNAKTKDMRMDTVKNIRSIIEQLDRHRKNASCGYLSAEYYVDLGKKVRYQRTALKLSQEELGMLWGVSQAEVSNIELGNRKVSVEQLFLLKMLRPSMDLNSLLGFHPEKGGKLYEQLRLLEQTLTPRDISAVTSLIELITNSGSHIR